MPTESRRRWARAPESAGNVYQIPVDAPKPSDDAASDPDLQNFV